MLRLGSGERTRRGSAAVRRLQRGLSRAGYAPGPLDGRYGPLTAAAVERFQANHALPVDGIVGPVTRLALQAAPVLALGAGEGTAHGSPAVAGLQRRLSRAGFTPGPIDGRFGPRTERAVVDFQRAHHLTVDGIAGPVTDRALQGGLHRTSTPTSPQGGAAPPHPAPARHVSHPKRNPRPRPAPASAPGTPRVAMIWVLIALGVLGLLAVVTGYFRRPIGSGAARFTKAIGSGRQRQATPETLPEPEPAPVMFLLYEDNSGGYYWTIVTDGGQVLARSARFASYEEANVAADIVYRGVAGASFEDRSDASPPGDLPASRDVTTLHDRTDAERRLDDGGSVSRSEVTRHAKAEERTWPAGPWNTPGGRRR
jgi:peptidoglycan hydrolase-like protein with peptidoglycan-binding domain